MDEFPPDVQGAASKPASRTSPGRTGSSDERGRECVSTRSGDRLATRHRRPTPVSADVGLGPRARPDALVAALEQWPRQASRTNRPPVMPGKAPKAVDLLRRSDQPQQKHQELAHRLTTRSRRCWRTPPDGPNLSDDPAAAHVRGRATGLSSRLASRSRCASLADMTTDEIARAFLRPGSTIAQRIGGPSGPSPRRTFRSRFHRRPSGRPGCPRCSEVIYLVSTRATRRTPARTGCAGAVRGRRAARPILAGLRPDEAEAQGLVALLEIRRPVALPVGPVGRSRCCCSSQDRSPVGTSS